MAIIDSDGRLQVRNFGVLTVILDRNHMPPSIEKLPGTSILIIGDKSTQARLAQWLETVEVSDASSTLNLGQGTVGRLRSALGLAEKYNKDSATTRWRRRKQK